MSLSPAPTVGNPTLGNRPHPHNRTQAAGTRTGAETPAPGKATGRRLGYRFGPVPDSLWDMIDEHRSLPVPPRAADSTAEKARRRILNDRLRASDADVMRCLLRFPRIGNTCWCSVGTIVKMTGFKVRSVKAALRRLSLRYFIQQYRVPKPDPEHPGNMTGWRIAFLFMPDEGMPDLGRSRGEGPDRRPPMERKRRGPDAPMLPLSEPVASTEATVPRPEPVGMIEPASASTPGPADAGTAPREMQPVASPTMQPVASNSYAGASNLRDGKELDRSIDRPFISPDGTEDAPTEAEVPPPASCPAEDAGTPPLRGSAPARSSNRREAEVDRRARDLHARLYEGHPPAAAAAEWAGSQDWYRKVVRQYLDGGDLTAGQVEQALAFARKVTANHRGKQFAVAIRELLDGRTPRGFKPPAPVPVEQPAPVKAAAPSVARPALPEPVQPTQAELHQWAEGPDPTLSRIARLTLAVQLAEAEKVLSPATGGLLVPAALVPIPVEQPTAPVSIKPKPGRPAARLAMPLVLAALGADRSRTGLAPDPASPPPTPDGRDGAEANPLAPDATPPWPPGRPIPPAAESPPRPRRTHRLLGPPERGAGRLGLEASSPDPDGKASPPADSPPPGPVEQPPPGPSPRRPPAPVPRRFRFGLPPEVRSRSAPAVADDPILSGEPGYRPAARAPSPSPPDGDHPDTDGVGP